MGFDTMLWLLALIAAVGAGCFYAGWRASRAYLSAAVQYGEVLNAAASQANAFSASLDKVERTLTSLQHDVAGNTTTTKAQLKAVEEALWRLFQGFERAGVVRTPSTRAVGRQVGETDPAD